jgi:uncharacterized repeat protein (TIGR03803 family)
MREPGAENRKFLRSLLARKGARIMKTARIAKAVSPLIVLGVLVVWLGHVSTGVSQAQGQLPFMVFPQCTATQTTGCADFSVLYVFGTGNKPGQLGDPIYPVGLLAQGADGNLYSTSWGGPKNLGTIFSLTPAGKLTVLYNFDGTLGSQVTGGLTLAKDGYFYGTAPGGGPGGAMYGFGTLFKIRPGDAAPQVLWNFKNGFENPRNPPPNAQQILDDGPGYPVGAPVPGKDGNLYGVTPYTNNYPSGALYRVNAGTGGGYQGIYLFKGTDYATLGVGFKSIIAGTDGNLYGTTNGDGRNTPGGWGAVFKYSPGASAPTGIHVFDSTHGAFPNSLIQANDGNLYGTALGGGLYAKGIVYQLTPSGVLAVLHDFTALDGENPVGGLVQAPDGYLYGATQGSGPMAGVVYRIHPGPPDGQGNSFAVVHKFDISNGSTSGTNPILGKDGNLYGTTKLGGKYNYGVFYRIRIASLASPPTPQPTPQPAPGCNGSSIPTGAIGQLIQVEGSVQVAGKPLAVCGSINLNDVVQTGAKSRAFILFKDGTQMTLSENSHLKIDDYVFNPSDERNNKATYSWLHGAFQYLSGLIAKRKDPQVNLETEWGNIGIRGTEFIGRYGAANLEVDLISGTLAIPPNDPLKTKTFTGPITIVMSSAGVKTSPLTQAQYNVIKAQLFPGR